MRARVFSTVIFLIFISCNKDEDKDPVIIDFSGQYQCIKYSYSSYYIPEINETIYWYDTGNVVIEVTHSPDPGSIIITLEKVGQIELTLKSDSTFTDFDPIGPMIGPMVTSGVFKWPDSIVIKRSGWSDMQYYQEYRYFGARIDNLVQGYLSQ